MGICQTHIRDEKGNLDLSVETQSTAGSIHDRYREEVAVIVDKWKTEYPTQDSIKAFYDAQSPEEYDKWSRGVNFYAEPQRITELIGKDKLVSVDPSTEVLDIGAGTGEIGRLLFKKQGFTTFYGIDASDTMIEKLK